MIVLLILALLAIGFVVPLIVLNLPSQRIHEQAQARLREVDAAHSEARRAMNDAADQSWRNLAG